MKSLDNSFLDPEVLLTTRMSRYRMENILGGLYDELGFQPALIIINGKDQPYVPGCLKALNADPSTRDDSFDVLIHNTQIEVTGVDARVGLLLAERLLEEKKLTSRPRDDLYPKFKPSLKSRAHLEHLLFGKLDSRSLRFYSMHLFAYLLATQIEPWCEDSKNYARLSKFKNIVNKCGKYNVTTYEAPQQKAININSLVEALAEPVKLVPPIKSSKPAPPASVPKPVLTVTPQWIDHNSDLEAVTAAVMVKQAALNAVLEQVAAEKAAREKAATEKAVAEKALLDSWMNGKITDARMVDGSLQLTITSATGVERVIGLEPTTTTLARSCSTN